MSVKVLQEYLQKHSDDAAELLSKMVQCSPVNPVLAGNDALNEGKVEQLLLKKLEVMGCEVYIVDVDFDILEPYKGASGYIPGYSDSVSFEGRPNILARLPGTDAKNYKSVLLSGHCDVIAADHPEAWKYPPFDGVITDGKIYGRGTVDMLGGLCGMIMTMEAFINTGCRPKGDIWYASLVHEECGGAGTLAVADFMKKQGICPDVAVMGEPTTNNVSVICRGVIWLELTVSGREGHIERTPKHWSEGGAVDAIEKARYLLDQIDRLNAEWRSRSDKDHYLTKDPCQVRIGIIQGGQHRSSYARSCNMKLDINFMPWEQNEKGLAEKVHEEFTTFIEEACQTDSWLKENPAKIDWIMEVDCFEIDEDNPFVKLLSDTGKKIPGCGNLMGKAAHHDGGWFERINGTPCVSFGPGEGLYAHTRDEFCKVDDLTNYTKILAETLWIWCNQSK